VGAHLELGLLGPLEVRIDHGLPAAVGGVRQKALLAVLALRAGEVVSSDRLIEDLWGENASATAGHTVQVFVSRLRGALGSAAARLVTRPPGYMLELAADELDAARCERLYDAARAALAADDPARAAELLNDAQALWRGPPLADFTYEPFAQAAIARLEELRVSCCEELVEAALALGRHREVVSDLEGLVREHPFRERPRGQLMLALYRCGRQADALDAFQQARRMFMDELALEPGLALRSLEQAILRQDPALDARHPATAVAGRSDPRPGDVSHEGRAGTNGRTIRLPLPWALERASGGGFVGREAELGRMLQWWSEAGEARPRPVLLTGEPGMGKTRLAGELGRVAHGQGALVLYGHCDEALSIPYQPFVEALRPYATALGPDGLQAELGAHARELGRLWPELASSAPPVHGDPEWGQAALLDAIRALLELAARARRVLLVLDDLHWAAGGTLLVLRHLLGPYRPPRVLVLASYREREPRAGSQLHQLVAHVLSTDDANRLALEGIDEAAVAALVADASGEAHQTRNQQLAHTLCVQTSGNPFFVRELLAHLVESGALSSEARRGWANRGARASSHGHPRARGSPVGAVETEPERRRGRRHDLPAYDRRAGGRRVLPGPGRPR
jgi:DNA-binding SARP family transcriptional activator